MSSLQNLVKLAGQEWRRLVPPRAAGTNTSTQGSIIRTWWEEQIPQEEDIWWVWTYLVTVLWPPGHHHLFVQLIVDCQKCLIHILYFVLMMRMLSWSRRQFADLYNIHSQMNLSKIWKMMLQPAALLDHCQLGIQWWLNTHQQHNWHTDKPTTLLTAHEFRDNLKVTPATC